MKIYKIKLTIVFLLLSALFILNATAQPRGYWQGQQLGERKICMFIPGLTEDQEDQIKAIRTEQLKERTQHRAQMDELRAKKRVLMLEDNPDMTEIENTIDQMTELRNKHLKRNATHRQNIRELLTEEQRVYYDHRRPNIRQYNRRPGMSEGRTGKAGRSGMSGKGVYRGR